MNIKEEFNKLEEFTGSAEIFKAFWVMCAKHFNWKASHDFSLHMLICDSSILMKKFNPEIWYFLGKFEILPLKSLFNLLGSGSLVEKNVLFVKFHQVLSINKQSFQFSARCHQLLMAHQISRALCNLFFSPFLKKSLFALKQQEKKSVRWFYYR